MSVSKKILVIGDGVAAWCLLSRLSRTNSNITLISSSNYPACSLSSTSINCLRGAQKNVSLLGDLIVDSYHAFERLIHDYNPDGVTEGVEYQIFNEIEKWENRYPEYLNIINDEFLNSVVKNYQYYHPNKAYFVDPVKLKNWFQSTFSNNVKYIDQTVASIRVNADKIKVIGEETDLGEFDKVYVCANYASKKLLYGLNSEIDYKLDHCKPVAGSYLEVDISQCASKFSNDFNLCLDKWHFIYRPSKGVIQIGSTTENNCDSLVANVEELSKIYNHIRSNTNIELPEFSAFEQRTGIRHKGYKRLPYWGEVAPNLYAIFGMYKNGYSFPFLASEQLVK